MECRGILVNRMNRLCPIHDMKPKEHQSGTASEKDKLSQNETTRFPPGNAEETPGTQPQENVESVPGKQDVVCS